MSALISRSSESISRRGQSDRAVRISSSERYHQIVCSEPARETVRRYSMPSRRSAVIVEPQAVELVGHDDVERPRLRRGELGQVLLLARLPRPLLAAPVELGLERVLGHRQRDRPELVRDLVLEHRPAIGRTLLQHVMEDAGHDRQLLAAVAREDDGDVGGVRQEIHPGAHRGKGVVILGRERERVVDAVGVSVHDRCVKECREAYASAG